MQSIFTAKTSAEKDRYGKISKLESETNRYLFEEMPVGRAVLNMAGPMVASQLIILIYNMADTFFIGRTGNPYMVAGASLLLPIYNLCIAAANISGTGGGTLIARLLGAKEDDKAAAVSSFSLAFSLAVSIIFALCTYIFMTPLLKALGASSKTFAYAKNYATCVIVIGCIPTVMSMTMGALLRNIGRSKEAGFGVSMGGVINIILDPLFMFVILPRGNEVTGAGIATALSNIIVCIYFIGIIAKMNSGIINFSTKNGLPDKENIRSFFSTGIPGAIGPLLFDIDYMVLDRLVASYSDAALAAIGIVLKVERFPTNVGVGLCLGMTPLAAYNYSSGNRKRMGDVVRTTRRTGIIVGVAAIALYEMFAPEIMRFFINDAATVNLGTGFLRARSPATVMMFLCFVYVHFFQGVGKGRTALFLASGRWVLFNIPALFILNRFFALQGLVWSQLICDTLFALVSLIIYLRFQKKERSIQEI